MEWAEWGKSDRGGDSIRQGRTQQLVQPLVPLLILVAVVFVLIVAGNALI